MKHVIIVNGKPRSGKDTFAECLNKIARVEKYSIIDKVKEIAAQCGWNGNKGERDRKFLCDVKIITELYNDMPFRTVTEKVKMFNEDDSKDVLLIDMREPRDIARAKRELGAYTIFIDNDRVPEIKSNVADGTIHNFNYDYRIDNNGTLEDLDKEVQKFWVYFISKFGR